MKARSLRLPRPIRNDPHSPGREATLSIIDAAMCDGVRGQESHRIGTIDVYYGHGPEGGLPGGETGEHYFIARFPRVDKMTGEPYTLIMDLTGVEVEPLSEEQERKVYGPGGEFRFTGAVKRLSPQQQVEAQVRGHRRTIPDEKGPIVA